MYTLSSQPYFVISSGMQKSRYWHFKDAHTTKTTQKILEQYIKDAQNTFVEKASVLADFRKAFTSFDEERLRAMLELLIDARKILEDESRQ